MFKFMLKLYITREITRENIIELRLKYMYTTYLLHSTLCHIIITYVEKWDIFAYIYQLSLWRKNIIPNLHTRYGLYHIYVYNYVIQMWYWNQQTLCSFQYHSRQQSKLFQIASKQLLLKIFMNKNSNRFKENRGVKK